MNSGRWEAGSQEGVASGMDDSAGEPKSCGIRSSAQQNPTGIVHSLYLLARGAERTLRNEQILRNPACETPRDLRSAGTGWARAGHLRISISAIRATASRTGSGRYRSMCPASRLTLSISNVFRAATRAASACPASCRASVYSAFHNG